VPVRKRRFDRKKGGPQAAVFCCCVLRRWWAELGSNQRPLPCESPRYPFTLNYLYDFFAVYQRLVRCRSVPSSAYWCSFRLLIVTKMCH